ncbi:MAG TPA: MgtC/SapB family protein [Vicinamibacterales bacterium]|nr:MgtC/SapB family protein [Vicinamibacterales bacterium]
MSFDLHAILNLAVAVIGGLGVGIEREWSGHATGPHARFAGVRTFTLLSLASGLAGWLWVSGVQGIALILLAGLCALIVVAYFAASRRDVDGTTEMAAFVVMAAGVLAGAGSTRVAAGILAVTFLLLVEKTRLHKLVSKLDREEIRAGARFAVMATVILPLLPEGPYGPLGGIKPRTLWAIVLFFSGLSFLGFVARRAFGQNRGYAIAGTLGGIVSSTGSTFTMAQLSRRNPEAGRALASGALGANVVLFPRVLISSLVLAPPLAAALWPAFILPAVIGTVLTLRGWRDAGRAHERIQHERNPLQFRSALEMTLIFQVVLFVIAYAKAHFSSQALYGTSALVGLAEIDALTISMARLTNSGTAADIAARAITIGVIANTATKLAITLVVGRGSFRPLAAIGLTLIGLALGAALYFR